MVMQDVLAGQASCQVASHESKRQRDNSKRQGDTRIVPDVSSANGLSYVLTSCESRGKQRRSLRAPDDLSNVVNAVRQFSQLLTTRQASCYVTEACQVLAEYHGPDQAVVARCVGYTLLVLNGPSG